MATLTEASTDLVAAHTNRLRCPGCHRFVGTVGTKSVTCYRCDVVYHLSPSGLYSKESR